MGLVTSIKPQRNKKRFNIFVDGVFSFSLGAEALIKTGLKENQEISPKKIEKLIEENEFNKIMDKILRFLSFRPRSKKEILFFLKKKQVGEKVEKMILEKLKELGLLDDKAFAKWWIEQRLAFKPVSKKVLSKQLKQKGISPEIFEEIISSGEYPEEITTAVKILEKRKRVFENLPPLKMEQKAINILLYRGFSYNLAKRAVVKFLKKG